MNTLHFKYAVEVERTRSITKAAENLYMAQPNLSKAIKELEETLGIEIFERTSKGVTPTKKGAEFLSYAESVLAEIEKMESLSFTENANYQRFNISIPRGSYIAGGITSFIKEMDFDKEIEFNIKETNSLETINTVATGEFNLGVVRYPVSYESYFLDFIREKNLHIEPIWEFEYLALMSKDSELATKTELARGDFDEYVEILHGDNIVPSLHLGDGKRLLREKADKPSKRIYIYERASQMDLLSNIPRTYMWVSPIPDELLKSNGLIQRKCSGSPIMYKDVLTYASGYELTELDKRFIDKLYSSKNSVAFRDYK